MEWKIAIKQINKEWTQFLLKNNSTPKKIRQKTRNGRWVMRNSKRTKFYLAWNGDRFAQSNELESLTEKYPLMLLPVEKFLQSIKLSEIILDKEYSLSVN